MMRCDEESNKNIQRCKTNENILHRNEERKKIIQKISEQKR